MKPENFMFHIKLFLSITNTDKRGKLDLEKTFHVNVHSMLFGLVINIDDNNHPLLDKTCSVLETSKN